MNTTLLTQLADEAIDRCMLDTSQVVGVGEIAQVARLVLCLPDVLVNAWRPHMTSGWMEIEGVFCHATPNAYWDDPGSTSTPPEQKQPELCDLMIVIETGVNRQSKADKRAFIVQAKLGESGSIKIGSGGPAVQRYMYANWPLFDLCGLPLDRLKGVNIAPNMAGSCEGGRYACVDVANRTWSIEAAQAPVVSPFNKLDDYASTVTTPESLGSELVAALAGQAGAECRGHWALLVHHLQLLAVARLFEGREPAGVKAQAAAKPLSHACRASTFVGRWEGTPFARTFGYDERVLYSLLERGGSVASTIPKGELLEPQQGFGVLKIRTSNLAFAEE